MYVDGGLEGMNGARVVARAMYGRMEQTKQKKPIL